MLTISQYSSFYYAPVCKSLIGVFISSSLAINTLFQSHRFLFVTSPWLLPEASFSTKILGLLRHRLVFVDTKDVIFGCILMYYFRIFERRYGSRKFFSFLLGNFSISLLVETIAMVTSQHNGISWNFSPAGPYCIIFSFFIPYFCDIPRVAISQFMGIPVTGKSLTYIIGLQMASSSLESFILASFGLISGIIYRSNTFYVQSLFSLPKCVSKVVYFLIGRFLDAPAASDKEVPMGATLELQRQQHLEQLEQQMMRQQMNQQQQAAFGWGSGIFRRRQVNREHRAEQEPPSEEYVRLLVEMGFPRASAENALRSTANDFDQATNILLSQSSTL